MGIGVRSDQPDYQQILVLACEEIGASKREFLIQVTQLGLMGLRINSEPGQN